MEGADWASYGMLANARAAEASERFRNNVEFRLPPIAIADMPHYSSEQQSRRTSIAPSSFDITGLEQRVELLEGSHPLLANSTSDDPQCPQAKLFPPEEYPEPERIPFPNKDAAPTTYTFVNVQTSTGRRNWEAETKIRSHSMKRVQQQRREAKRLLQTESGDSTSGARISHPCLRQDRETRICPCMGSASTLSLGTHETLASPNMTKDNNVPSLASCTDGGSKSDYCHCGRMKLVHHAGPNAVTMGAPSSFPQSSFLSLFNKSNLRITSQMESLLYYMVTVYFEITMPRIYAISPWMYRTLGGLARDDYDDPNLHGWCSIVAYHKSFQMMSLASSRTSTMKHVIDLQREQASQYMHNSMRMINRRFQQNKDILSSPTVMAVATLVICAAFSGEPDACKTHHDGLVKLIELRGGIDTFHRSQALHLSRIDSNAAWTEGRRPRLPMYSSPAQVEHSDYRRQWLSPSLQEFLSAPLSRVARALQMLSNLLDDQSGGELITKSLPQQDIDYYEDMFAAVQHGIADFPYPENYIDDSVAYYRQNCWRNASFIYLNTVVRGAPTKALIGAATGRLIDSLTKSDLWTGWVPHTGVLMWVLFMGLHGSTEDVEKSLFALQFQRLIRDTGLLSFEQIREGMQQQLWRGSALDQPLKDAWMTATAGN